jgi:hypothetical protein
VLPIFADSPIDLPRYRVRSGIHITTILLPLQYDNPGVSAVVAITPSLNLIRSLMPRTPRG